MVSMSKDILVLKEEFYAAIGHALTSWGYVETALCSVFCACVGPPTGFPTSHAFWAVFSFEGKLNMVDAVMTASFPADSDIAKRWTTLNNRLSRKNRTRNRIAHGSVIAYPFDTHSNLTLDVFFAPFFWGTLGQNSNNETDRRPQDRMYIPDIERATVGFNALVDELSLLWTDVFEIVQRPTIQQQKSTPGQ